MGLNHSNRNFLGPWSKYKRVVDVGGSRGHFLHRILTAHPNTTGIVVDRPSVIKLAQVH
jgi:hypothetical protein